MVITIHDDGGRGDDFTIYTDGDLRAKARSLEELHRAVDHHFIAGQHSHGRDPDCPLCLPMLAQIQ